jgi:hypothetical protein
MKRTDSSARSPLTPRVFLAALGTFVILTALPRPAGAQFSQLGAVLNLASIGVLGTDVGYDEARDQFLFVGAYGPVFAMCTNASGQPTTALFDVMNNPAFFAHFPRAEYSPDLGAFLVTWHQNDAPNINVVHGRLVSCAGGPVSADVAISNVFEDGTRHDIGAPAAYSLTSHVFLVAWQSASNGIRGRFVSSSGVPLGTTMLLANIGGARDPGLAWNAATNEFGMSYTGWDVEGAFAAFRKIRASDGALSPLQKFGYGRGTYNTDITVNTANWNYVMGWVALPGGSQFATFDYSGNKLNYGLMTTRFGGSDNLSLAFNPASGTILSVGQDFFSYEIAAMELNGGGIPISSAGGITQGTTSPGSFYPRVNARRWAPHWGLSFSRRYNTLGAQFVASGGAAPPPSTPPPAPPPPPPSGGCTTPDPFAALGGGTCVNGGWLPPGSAPAPAPAPAPPPPTSGPACTGPDPFAAMGGGHCVNGGWVPGVAGGCVGPNPFASGGTCVNGGWVPSGGAGGGSTGGCIGPNPFAGGGTCVNGGWVPSGGAGGGSTGGCIGPDPFAAMGGGHCVNGGWVPGVSGGCVGSDPFAAMGGGHCVSGGWVPGPAPSTGGTSTGGCAGSDPFAAIGGGICVNGGWIPAPPSTCSGLPDPFVAIGGGICINGGWHPRGRP